jgi:ABC-type transporter Mla subunit MlaD
VLFDFASSAVRSALRLVDGAGQELEKRSTVEPRLHEAISALHRTADSMDRHVEVLEGLATSLPALTDAVAKLTEQLTELLTLAAPLEAAEREVTGIGHLFHRRRHRRDDTERSTDQPA